MEHDNATHSCDLRAPVQVLIPAKLRFSYLRPSHSLTSLPNIKPSSPSFQQRVKDMRQKGASVVRGLARWEALLSKTPQHDIAFQIIPLCGVPPVRSKHKLPPVASYLQRKVTKQSLKSQQPDILSLTLSASSIAHSKKTQVCNCNKRTFRQADLHIRELYPMLRQSLPQLQCLYHERAASRTALTLAIVFDGVLGDVWKPCLTDTSPKCLSLRRNAEAGLEQLQIRFHLVLITFLSSKKTYRLLSYFRTQRISFQAAYCLPKAAPRDVVDYSPVLHDLELAAQQLLVVTGLDLSFEDLTTDEGVLFVRAGRKLRLTAKGLPLPGPTAFLVPSIRAQEAGQVLPFTRVAEAILQLGHKSDWACSFTCTTYPHFNTSVAFEVALEHTLPHPTAHFVRKCRDKCPLHHSLKGLTHPSRHSSPVILLNLKPELQTQDPTQLEIHPLKLSSGCLNLLHFTQSRLFKC